MAADTVRKGGGWPNGVGWMNETESLVAAIRRCWSIDDANRARLNLPETP